MKHRPSVPLKSGKLHVVVALSRQGQKVPQGTRGCRRKPESTRRSWELIRVKLAPPKRPATAPGLCQDWLLCQFEVTTFLCFLWIQERLCSSRSERVIKQRSETVAFAIEHFLRVNHLPSNCFTDGEPTGRYQTFGLPLCLALPDLQQFQWLFSAANLPGFWE